MLFIAFVVNVADRHHPTNILDAALRLDVIGGDLAHVLIWGALLLQAVDYRTSLTVFSAVTQLIRNELIFIV